MNLKEANQVFLQYSFSCHSLSEHGKPPSAMLPVVSKGNQQKYNRHMPNLYPRDNENTKQVSPLQPGRSMQFQCQENV